MVKLDSRLSKYNLCQIFGLINPSGVANYNELKAGYFTNDVLITLGITPEEYRKIRRFSRVHSLKIIHLLEIEAEDLLKLNTHIHGLTL